METQKRPNAAKVGLYDRMLEGWFNGKTGELTEGVPIHATDTVVDVGCGDGGFTNFCAMQGAEVVFIDSNENKIKATADKIEKTAARAYRGIVSECNPIPLPDGYADVLLCTEVLEHVPDPKQFLDELIRITKPGGTLLITVPDSRSEQFVGATAPPQYFQIPNHIRIFSADDFRELIEGAGLVIEKHQFMGAFWSIYWPLAWLAGEPGDEGLPIDSQHPMVQHWVSAWHEVQRHPEGERIRDTLNLLLPKSQSVICRKSTN